MCSVAAVPVCKRTAGKWRPSDAAEGPDQRIVQVTTNLCQTMPYSFSSDAAGQVPHHSITQGCMAHGAMLKPLSREICGSAAKQGRRRLSCRPCTAAAFCNC